MEGTLAHMRDAKETSRKQAGLELHLTGKRACCLLERESQGRRTRPAVEASMCLQGHARTRSWRRGKEQGDVGVLAVDWSRISLVIGWVKIVCGLLCWWRTDGFWGRGFSRKREMGWGRSGG